MLERVEYKTGVYNEPSLLVLGCFDAIHIGHRELLKKAKLQAMINGLDLGVMLFRDGKGTECVFSLEERLELLEKYNVKFVLLVDFNDEFKQISAKDFLDSLCNQLNVKAFMSGSEFRFGNGAKGKVSTLKSYAADEENAIWYMSVKEVKTDDGHKVSTSDIKDMLVSGDLLTANQLLGCNFHLSGEVTDGHKRGTTLGFPTANVVYPQGKIQLQHGVYKVSVEIDGMTYYGVANYGTKPTFDEDDITLEIYFDGLDASLYGQTISVEFLSYIRGTRKFNDENELEDQIRQDLLTLHPGQD